MIRPHALLAAAFLTAALAAAYADLADVRSGFWHYEKSHAVVLERNYECGACHAELAPYRRGAHRIDRLAQIDNCAWCHGTRPQ